jgi:heat shock protein HspQ
MGPPGPAAAVRAPGRIPAAAAAFAPRVFGYLPSEAIARGGGSVAAGGRDAKFAIGDIVRHRFFPFRGVIYDVDPEFGNTEEWWLAIPEALRPAKDQPYYHLLAENAETTYAAYVSEQNLLLDESDEPCRHPLVEQLFEGPSNGRYSPRRATRH